MTKIQNLKRVMHPKEIPFNQSKACGFSQNPCRIGFFKVLVIEFCNLKFICDLVLVIWNLSKPIYHLK